MNFPRRLTAVLAVLALVGAGPVQGRVFVLPGANYSQDLGWTFSASGVLENSLHDRYTADLAYFQQTIGQAKFTAFFPRTAREWTFLAEYLYQDYPGFSWLNASDLTKLYSARRRSLEFNARVDFPRSDGFFHGFQGSVRRFDYLPEEDISAPDNPLHGQAIMFADGEEYTGSLRVGLERRDNRYNTLKGMYLLWQVDLGLTRSQGDVDELVRMSAEARRYFPLGWDRTVLALNLRGGVLHHRVPYFSRFTLGGQYDLRGFPNDRYNGNAFYLARTELRQTVVDRYTVKMNLARKLVPGLPDYEISAGFVIFTEGGDLYRDDAKWWGFRQTAGAGLRLMLPPNVVGSLDLARPVEGGDWSLYLSLEQSF